MSEETDIATVKEVIADFVANGYMFTAFDITVYLRARHSGIRMRHAKVNEIVVGMYGDGNMMDYTRTTITLNLPVGNTSAHAWLYHHRLAQPSRYVTDWLTTNPAQDNMRYAETPEPDPVASIEPVTPPSIPLNTDDDLTI